MITLYFNKWAENLASLHIKGELKGMQWENQICDDSQFLLEIQERDL